MTRNPKKVKMYGMITFYDFMKKNLDWKSLYEWGLNFCNQYRQKPMRMSLDGDKVKESTTTKSFHHYNKVINDLNFENIDDFWFGAGYPPVEERGGDYNSCNIGYSVSFQKTSKIIIFYFDTDLIQIKNHEIRKISETLQNFSKAKYGFYTQKNQYKESVFLYANSILESWREGEEESTILNWDRAYRDPYDDCGTYKTGDFRDLYPLNFIGEAHLKREVFGQTLQQWIEADSSRGTLEPLNDSLWSWEIPQENIPDLRQQLKPTDLLVCFRPYE